MQRNRKGQGLVESAFVLLVFVFVFLGILDFGQFLYFHQSLTERVRVATRYGAVHTYTDGMSVIDVEINTTPSGTVDDQLPNVNAPSETNAAKATVTAGITNPGNDDARIRVTIANYPLTYLILPSSLAQRTVSYSQPYEIGR